MAQVQHDQFVANVKTLYELMELDLLCARWSRPYFRANNFVNRYLEASNFGVLILSFRAKMGVANPSHFRGVISR